MVNLFAVVITVKIVYRFFKIRNKLNKFNLEIGKKIISDYSENYNLK